MANSGNKPAMKGFAFINKFMSSDMSIARKLLTGFGIICAFILLNAVFTVAIHVYTRVQQSVEAEEYIPMREDLNQMQMLVTESSRLSFNWAYGEPNPDLEYKVRLRAIVDTEFYAVYEEVQKKTGGWDSTFICTLDTVNTKVLELFDYERTIMENLSSFDSYNDVMATFGSQELVGVDGEVNVITADINVLMDRLIEICNVKCEEIASSISLWSAVQLMFVILFSLIVMAMSVFVGWMLYQTIVAPLKKGVAFAKAIGDGDLTVSVEVDSKDELGQLSEALTEMVTNVRNIVLSIERNANDLVDSGDGLKSNSLKLNKGASEQAASAEEVSTAIEEMVANIDQNTENAIATEKITAATVENVTLSSQYSNEAAEAMSQISQKITIISDIAFQTNILALNAAVEAVRAGEHGRGFAVVAAEVRKLAERSKQAANEIVSLVARGMKVSQLAGDKAKDLVPEMEKTTVLIKEISAASIEQKTGAEQINMAMQNLNVITQENASAADELTNSSVQLSELASNLKAAVSFFKLDESAERNVESQSPVKSSTKNESNKKTAKVENHEEPAQEQPSNDHHKGATINLGSTKEYDIDNYEKF
ncbi:MAG: methyl-accepting chemotaxis protein [Bacteroidales bacterium]|nr:methyl-accepting chemotaxis protein [Bacteroidales bacterium]